MKLLLAKYSPKSVRTIFEDLSETDSIQTISESVFGRNIDTLERALQLLDFQKIEQAVDVLSRAKTSSFSVSAHPAPSQRTSTSV